VPLENLLAMALALGVGGLVKGATGMGLPLLALPILAAFLGVQHAVALMCLPVIITNFWQVWRFRAAMWEGDFLPAMALGGAAGVAVGTWFIVSVPERALSLALALLVFTYIALRLANPHFAVPRRLGKQLAPGFGFGAGVLQGATGIGSPISVTFIHAMRLGRAAHVFAVSVTFLLYTVVQIPALAVAGVMTWGIALEGVIAMLPALATMPLGNWLAGRISQAVFDRIVLALLAVVALELSWKSIAP
jgi:uncharacterized membrane protein YfcA